MEQWPLGGKAYARFFKHLPLPMVLSLIRRIFDCLSDRTDHDIGNGLSFGAGKEKGEYSQTGSGRDSPLQSCRGQTVGSFVSWVCDLCIEFLSDSTPAEVERDTVHKKKEYAKAGVAEYYILDRLRKHTAFYFLNQQGIYETMEHKEPGVIHSRVLDRFAFRLEDLEKQVVFETLIEDPLYQPFLLKSFQEERQQKEKERKLKENALAREKIALAREEIALAEVERLRALLQEKDSDPR